MDYKSSGVDIDAGNETVRRIKRLAQATFTPGVLSEIGSFGGLFKLDTAAYKEPVLVSSADGVGTKLKVAFMANRHRTIGADLVNHCVNDILVQGATPLFFLDYLATGRLSPDVAEQIVELVMIRELQLERVARVGGRRAAHEATSSTARASAAPIFDGSVPPAWASSGRPPPLPPTIGAIWLIYLLGYNMSIGVWVGLIALLGVDAETAVFMLLYLNLSYEKAKKEGRMKTLADLQEAIHDGAVKRIRPKFMTVATMFVGLVPIMWSTGTGADVMKRIAAPMIGGIFTSFILELVVYPAIYEVWKWNTEVKKQQLAS